ncbi:MAG TPA: hypothetical protein VGR23_06685 [Candidatus Dormibacteraeota bacterium]|jgi:hypothetical protein|nr:hypothetical protein [Candidatus Dormibacteraeota bacterium]
MASTAQPGSLEVIWTRALDVAPPWRIAVFLILGVLVVGRFLPWLIRTLGGLASAAAEPVASLLLLPEYLLSNWRRRVGRPPLPGTYAYDNALERAVQGTRTGAHALARSLGKRRKIRWRRVILAALLPAILWYSNLYLPETQTIQPVADFLDNAQRPLLATDALITKETGIPAYRPAPATKPKPAPACQPSKTKKRK